MRKSNPGVDFIIKAIFGGAATAAFCAAAYFNSDRSKTPLASQDLDDYAKSHPDEIHDWLNYGILCDYVYHTRNSPTSLPPGIVALTLGQDNLPLDTHNKKTGFYAEAFAEPMRNSQGAPVQDQFGNIVPGKIIIAWRGSVLYHSPRDFKCNEKNHDLGKTIASDTAMSLSQIPRIVNQSCEVRSIERLTGILEAKIRDAYPDREIPIVYTGLSQGATNAMIAAAKSSFTEKRVIAFNALPHGGLLTFHGFNTPELLEKVTLISAGGDSVIGSTFSRVALATLNGFQGAITGNGRQYNYGHYPLFVGRLVTLPTREKFLDAHHPGGLVHALGALFIQAERGEEAASIVSASYTGSKRPAQIVAFLRELEQVGEPQRERHPASPASILAFFVRRPPQTSAFTSNAAVA